MKTFTWERAVKASKLSEDKFTSVFEAIGGYNAKKDSYTKLARKNGWVTEDDSITQDCVDAIKASAKTEVPAKSANSDKIIDQLLDKINDLEQRVRTLEFEQTIEPVQKEKKPRKPIDWSTKARSLIGTKYNGWSFKQDKLNVICSKPGKEDIIVAGMKNVEDVKDMLD